MQSLDSGNLITIENHKTRVNFISLPGNRSVRVQQRLSGNFHLKRKVAEPCFLFGGQATRSQKYDINKKKAQRIPYDWLAFHLDSARNCFVCWRHAARSVAENVYQTPLPACLRSCVRRPTTGCCCCCYAARFRCLRRSFDGAGNCTRPGPLCGTRSPAESRSRKKLSTNVLIKIFKLFQRHLRRLDER